MGKQRTPHGQRAGRRMPPRRGPTPAPAAEMPAETMAAVEPQPSQGAAGEDIAPSEAEILEAVPVGTGSDSEPEAEPVAEPAADEPAEIVDASAAGMDAVIEPQAIAPAAEPEESTAVEGPAGETSAEIVLEKAVEALDEARAAPNPDEIPPDTRLPVAAFAALDAAGPSDAGAGRPAAARTSFRFAFAPARIDIEGIGVVLANYMHNESVAVLGYMRALGAARSPADMIRLNVTAMQRAADASLTCWSDIARRTAQGVPWQREKAAA